MNIRIKALFLLLLNSFSVSHITSCSGFYFLRMEFHELEGYVINVEKVYDDFECILKCRRANNCKSVNYAYKPGADGLHECVLLKYRAASGMYGPLRPSHKFHYYYKEEDCDKPLGLESRAIPDSAITASSSWDDDPLDPAGARLHSNKYWTCKYKRAGEWLQVDLGKVMAVVKVATQGRAKLDGQNKWISKYSISSSMDQIKWQNYTENGVMKIFDGNSDQTTVVTNSFKEKIAARYVRLIVQAFNNRPELRMELYGCEFP